MAIQDSFNGAKNAFAFYGAYLNTVAQELGLERALVLHTKMLEGMGSIQGKAIKPEAGAGEINAKAAYSLAKVVPETLGLVFEVQEENPSTVRWRCQGCSVYEGWRMAGLDDRTLETMCREGSIRFMDAAVKQLNPRLSYEIVRYRSAADDSCDEQIVLR